MLHMLPNRSSLDIFWWKFYPGGKRSVYRSHRDMLTFIISNVFARGGKISLTEPGKLLLIYHFVVPNKYFLEAPHWVDLITE